MIDNALSTPAFDRIEALLRRLSEISEEARVIREELREQFDRARRHSLELLGDSAERKLP